MNIETLAKLIRPDLIDNYWFEWNSDQNMSKDNIEEDKLLRYEIVKETVEADGSPEHLGGVDTVFIIRNKDTNEHYKVAMTHDSWDDEVNFKSAEITKVQPEEVTMVVYEKVLKRRVSVREL